MVTSGKDDGTKDDGTKETGSIVLDIHSPYSLNASDHPGQVFVPDLLSDTNYGEWASDMSEVLFAKNKFGFVDKTLAKPADTDKEQAYWLRCDAMVRGWLKSSMTIDLRRSVRFAATASQIWDDLKERFGRGSSPRAYELRRALSLLHQADLGISAYYTRQRALWDELQAIAPHPTCSCNQCKCGLQKSIRDAADKERLYTFLMGLNEPYSSIRSHILSLQSVPSLSLAYHMVSEDEQQRLISSSSYGTDAAALQTVKQSSHSGSGIAGSSAPLQSHGRASDVRTDKQNKGPRCPVCRRTGHTREECFVIIGYPDWWRGRTGITDASNDTRKPPSRAAQVVVTDTSNQFGGFTSEQVNKLLALLGPTSSSANQSGPTNEDLDWEG